MSKRASADDCRLIRLPKHERENGNITVVENDIDLPFAVKRVYYLYDVPGGEERGGHSHKQLYEFLVAAGGSFDVVLDDGVRISLETSESGSLKSPKCRPLPGHISMHAGSSPFASRCQQNVHFSTVCF